MLIGGGGARYHKHLIAEVRKNAVAGGPHPVVVTRSGHHGQVVESHGVFRHGGQLRERIVVHFVSFQYVACFIVGIIHPGKLHLVGAHHRGSQLRWRKRC
ncbi:MAG: hypothetical protein D6698_07320 [Gammaproteobacteria bacterium]|nr:MAG: hypothetical protein D6698_07320 [Gammaproteobacteria bacterium]